LLELDLPAGTPAHRQVQEILRGGRHLLALIDDILDLGRIESGRVDLAIEAAVVVAEVVEDCLRLVQPLAAARGIAVTVDVAAGLAVRADRLRLRQVLMNLLSNAIKYNVDGGQVEVRAGADAARVRVAVRDSGCGIAPQRLGELFQPFNRLGAERGPVEGTGIGLVIARELVERMGGAIGVDSVAGAGSTFWIELPGGVCAGVLAEIDGGPPPAPGG
jgi:signal transduction histidine kinase